LETRLVSLATPSPVAGDVIDGFTVAEEIGRGAHSIVYRVGRDGNEFALKLQYGSEAADGAAQAFSREAAMLAGLRNPGLVRIHEVGETAGRPYLLMELLRGRTLREALLQEAPWTEQRAVTMARAAAGALAAAHRTGLVHRDVKPENIFIASDRDADVTGTKVIDFAVGRFLLNLAVEHGGLLLALDDAQWFDDATHRVLAALLGRADTALLRAKARGRNCVVLAD
jgi:serine/threonine protein kinase